MRVRLQLLLLLILSLVAQAQIPVALRTNTKARQAPNAQSSIVANLHKGETFVITDDRPYWYRITLKNGRPAWVPKSSCTVLDPEDVQHQQEAANQPIANPPSGGQPVEVPACHPTSVPTDWTICPATGTGGMYAQAYVQKNRSTVPCAYAAMTVDDMLALEHLPKSVRALPANDPRLLYLKATEQKTVVVEGFLALTKDGGQEGVNCNSPTRIDTHMELVDTDQQDPKTNRSKHVIAEVTPWFHASVSAWSTQDLGHYASYVNDYHAPAPKNSPTKIHVYGYLFFDEAHATGAENWRGSAWEVHPITKIEVFENGQWKEVGGVH